ncbi:RDD family protein [Streptomyces cremeus]|uniref:RDD family protein n=1 Tax=Streptomyces cremeus TaxID=66881 RepID=A0ABV5PHD8_STRCM
MSAPTPANGENAPGHGFYPDPSIPGYVRYWNGSSWVPGTSRPAPAPGEPMPVPPPGAVPVASPAASVGLPDLAQVPAPAPRMEETVPFPSATEEPGPYRSAVGEPGPFRSAVDRRGPFPSAAEETGPFPSTAEETFRSPANRRGPFRPAPDETGPFPPAVEETGPFFFDEDEQPAAQHPARPASSSPSPSTRPAATGPARETPPGAGHEVQVRRAPESPVAWQADTSRQSGFGGDHDRRVSWGSPSDAAPAAAAPASSGTPPTRPASGASRPAAPLTPAQDRAPGPRDPRTPADALPARAERPALEPTPAAEPDGRRGRPQGAGGASPAQAEPGPRGGGAEGAPLASPRPAPENAAPRTPAPAPTQAAPSRDGTMTIRSVTPDTRPPAQTAPAPRGPAAGQVPAGSQAPAQSQAQTRVAPWKPPVEDPFTRAAREQGNARPAGLGRRLAARLLDTLVLGAAVAAVAVPLVTRAVDHIEEKIRAAKLSGTTVTVYLLDSTTLGILGAVLGAFLLLGLLYEAVPTAKWGRTLGKKVFGLQVRDIEEHEPPRFGGALRRWLVYGVLGVLGIGVLNVLWCLFDRPWRQCWHDKAARTFVAGRPGRPGGR